MMASRQDANLHNSIPVLLLVLSRPSHIPRVARPGIGTLSTTTPLRPIGGSSLCSLRTPDCAESNGSLSSTLNPTHSGLSPLPARSAVATRLAPFQLLLAAGTNNSIRAD